MSMIKISLLGPGPPSAGDCHSLFPLVGSQFQPTEQQIIFSDKIGLKFVAIIG
jgi:hypothetical protein